MLMLLILISMVIATFLTTQRRPGLAFATAGDPVWPVRRATRSTLGGISRLYAITTTLLLGPGSSGGTTWMDFQTWTIIATADADTATASITHAMGIFARGFFRPVLAAAQISLWFFSTIPAAGSTWVATKATTATSGNAGVQVQVEVQRAK